MKTEQNNFTIEQETVRDCPLLYNMRYRPCTETCMCFGWEFSHGWDQIISDVSRELEMLNIQFYPKYRVRIQADQIKEKFGTLRFYYSIVQDPCAFVTWLAHKFERLEQYLSNYKKFNYKTVRVIDVEPFDYDDTREITKDRYVEMTDPNYKGCKPSNVDYVEKDGKYFEVCHLRNYGKSHIEATRLKLLWHLKEFARTAYHRLIYSASKDTSAIRNCKTYLDIKAQEVIRKAEEECEKHCEKCGHQIGTDWSPVCTTRGWITNICDECAEKSGKQYYKNDELWYGKERLKTKEELQKKYAKNEEK